jgi:hypothetical protein
MVGGEPMSTLKVNRIEPRTGDTVEIVGFDVPSKSILQQKYISTTVDEVAGSAAHVSTSLRIDITPTDETSRMFISLSAGFRGDIEDGCKDVRITRSFDNFANQEILYSPLGTGRTLAQHGTFFIDDVYSIENGSLQPMSYLIQHLGTGSSTMKAGATLLVWEMAQ